MNSVDQKLIEMKYRYLKKANLEFARKDLQEHIEREQQTLLRLQKDVDKEQEDVDKLEHASLNHLLISLTGRSKLRLEKEKADAFRAVLDYKLKKEDIEYLNYQYNLLLQELQKYEDLDQEYQGLLEIKRKTLPMETLNSIRSMEKTIEEWKVREKQLREAIEQGQKLRSSFTFVLDHLSELVEETTDAKSLWYPAISQDEIEDVSEEVARLNHLWMAFEAILATLDVELPEDFDKEFLLQVCDFYEMNKQKSKRIDTSFVKMNATYSSVRTLLCKLDKMLSELQYCIQDLHLEIRSKIESN